jgi:uncharacterized protein (TIGR00369 family)
MRKLNPAYVTAATKIVNECPYFSLISMELKELEWSRCRIEAVVQEKHLQPFGVVHGGVIAGLVDAAAFWAVFSQVDEDLGMTTVDLKVNYLLPASQGILIAKGRSLKVGKTLCLGEALIEDENGALLAHGTSTMMVLKDLPLQGLPPGRKNVHKFLD